MLQTHAGRTGSTVAPTGWRTSEPAWIHLRSAGVSLLLQVPRTGLPVVRHWGTDLGPLQGPDAAPSLDALLLNGPPEERRHAIIPGCGEVGRLGLVGSHDGQSTRPSFTDVQTRPVSRPELASGVTALG